MLTWLLFAGGPAQAQVVNGDFETGPDEPLIEPLEVVLFDFEDGIVDGWDPGDLTTWGLDPIYPSRGTYGLATDTQIHQFVDYDGFAPDTVITHETFGLSMMFAGAGDYTLQAMTVWLATTTDFLESAQQTPDPPLFPATWSQLTIDTSPVCGDGLSSLTLFNYEQFLHPFDDYNRLHNTDTWFIDDGGFMGPACAIFVDWDGDGLCSEGIDLDGDGECVDTSAGEPTPGVVQDANEPLP